MSHQDWQFNRAPIVEKIVSHEFSVSRLLKYPGGPDWNHPLYFDCEYCHKEITVRLSAPLNIANYVKDEARRLANLHHLRTEHVKDKSASENSN
jgi:hypothetical protein